MYGDRLCFVRDVSLTVFSTLLKNRWTNFDETCNEYCLVFHLVTQQASILWRLYLRSNFEICGRYHWMSDPRESRKISLSITFTELILTVSLDEILSNMHCKFCQNLSTRFRVMLRKLLWTFVIPKCTGRDRDLSAMCPLQFLQHYFVLAVYVIWFQEDKLCVMTLI